MPEVLDIEKLHIVRVDDRADAGEKIYAEVLIVGGGLGGVAAALAACAAGRTVCLVEETSWLGGQATSQGVSALDENHLVETTGGTRDYLRFRTLIREWYRRNATLIPSAAADPKLNPGRGWVSRLCFEPGAAVEVIHQMLATHVGGGHLRILMRCKACGVEMDGDRVAAVRLAHLDGGRTWRAEARMVIDATELGDLLALGAADYITGSESIAQTGEPDAFAEPDLEDVQSFTYTFAVDHLAGQRHLVSRHDDYPLMRDRQPYTFTLHYHNRGDLTYSMFARTEGSPGSFWTYRRLIDAGLFKDPRYARDIAMINWPGNDYRGGNILVASPAEQRSQLRAARDLSLGFLHWLQTEAPRDDGDGCGYPGLRLRLDVMDTDDGLSKFPYIRESRRLLAVKTIVEQEITTRGPRAVHFDDSVGIGLYGIDLHESKRNRQQIIRPAKPFQIPLGALIPRRTANLLAGCKNIGTTHITNGCYRLHPVEWNIGESAGATAAFCIERDAPPRRVRDEKRLLRELQQRLVERGVPIMWYDDVPNDDARFADAQLMPFDSPAALRALEGSLHGP